MTEYDASSPIPPAEPPARRTGFNPFRALLDLFTSVRFGVFLMVLIFIYCTIGSAGILYPTTVDGKFVVLHDFIRKWRPFEMTEYEWFNTPLFVAMIALLCINMAVVTVRKIRFNTVNLGVWMIHTGIIILALSSVWYFATKVEGDTPVFRWRVLVETPGREPVSMAVLPNSSWEIDAPDGTYRFSIAQLNPNWPLMSEGFEGKTAYAITVMCTTPRGTFMRQLLDGYPQFTEDIIPGQGRVKKIEEFEGRALLDEQLKLSLIPDAQESFWVKDSAVMSIRQVVDGTPGLWHERPLRKLPRYNDYVAQKSDVFLPTDLMLRTYKAHPLDFEVPANGDHDPLTGVTVRVTGHLRYARMQSQFAPTGSSDAKNPVANITLSAQGGIAQPIQLVANDPEQNTALQGLVELRTVSSLDEVRALSDRESQRLLVHIPETGDAAEINLDELREQGAEPDFVEVGESGYAVRFRQVLDHRPQSPEIGALIDIRAPDRVFSRWVPMMTTAGSELGVAQDFILEPGAEMPTKVEPSDEINTAFDAGIPPLTLVAGPESVGLRAIGRLVDLPEGLTLHTGATVQIQQALTLSVIRYLPDAKSISKPVIVPPNQRDKNVDESRSATLVRVEVQDAKSTQTEWVEFDRYLLDDEAQQALVSGAQPPRFTLADGRVFDIAVGRKRMDLPAPVILEDFELLTHVGGYSGSSASVRDWVSHIAFASEEDGGRFTEKRTVAVNNPKPFGGYWYFQSFWDAPNQQRGTPGQTFTGLGVGNRNGVHWQLIGSAISVVGMIYAFYLKPIIKRKRAERVRAAVARGDYGDKAKQRLQGAAS